MYEYDNSKRSTTLRKKEESPDKQRLDVDEQKNKELNLQHKSSKSMNPKLCDIILQNLNQRYNNSGYKLIPGTSNQGKLDKINNYPESNPFVNNEKLSTNSGKYINLSLTLI
jgi:hypothetical protein